MPLSLTLQAAILSVQHTKTNDGDTGSFAPTANHKIGLTNGTGAGQVDILWRDLGRSIAASANDDLDLRGVLTDFYGDLVNLVKVKGLVIKAADANVNTVVVGGAAANPFLLFSDATDKLPIKPKGWLEIYGGDEGYPVTAGTGDILRVANGGAGSAVLYDIWLIGTSA